MMEKTEIIFFGTSEFAVPSLGKLLNLENIEVSLVVTQPDKPVGRKQAISPSPVKILAQKFDIQIFQPEEMRKAKSEMSKFKPDLIIVCAYGQMIPSEILTIPKFGVLNIHPSLLPKYRGPSPIQAAILNGDKKTGVSIMLLDEEMDHGPLLAQREIRNPKFPPASPAKRGGRGEIRNHTPLSSRVLRQARPSFAPQNLGGQAQDKRSRGILYSELSQKLAELGADLLVETLPKYLSGEIKPIPQDHSKATYCKILKKEDGKIDWNKSAEEIERMVRAYEGWPGTFSKWHGANGKWLRLKILKSRLYSSSEGGARVEKSESEAGRKPGEFFKTKNGELAVQCGKGIIALDRVQPEGKKPMPGPDFARGYLK